jgi:hypothetical protein
VRYIVEPKFDDGFMIDLHDVLSESQGGDVAGLIDCDAPIHIILTKHTGDHPAGISAAGGISQGDVGELYSSYKLEWRKCLSRGSATMACELNGAGQERKMKVTDEL